MTSAAALIAIIILWAAGDVVVAGIGCILRALWYPERWWPGSPTGAGSRA